MKWFGESWGARVNDPTQRVSTPVENMCEECGIAFQDGDRGIFAGNIVNHKVKWIPYHIKCWIHVMNRKGQKTDRYAVVENESDYV